MANDISAQAFREAAARLVACQTCSNTGFIAVWSGGSLEGEGCPDCPQVGPEYKLLLAAAEQREQLTWQDIESAPKDGTLMIVSLIRDGVIWRVSDASFNGLGWYTKSGESCHWRTHWMPLPEVKKCLT